MPDKAKIAKADEWFSVQFWFNLLAGSLESDHGQAEKVMALMASLREMIEETKPGRKAASRAVQNAIQACGRHTMAQILAERAERRAKKQLKKRAKKRGKKKGRG